jgi:hypothetical protein
VVAENQINILVSAPELQFWANRAVVTVMVMLLVVGSGWQQQEHKQHADSQDQVALRDHSGVLTCWTCVKQRKQWCIQAAWTVHDADASVPTWQRRGITHFASDELVTPVLGVPFDCVRRCST